MKVRLVNGPSEEITNAYSRLPKWLKDDFVNFTASSFTKPEESFPGHIYSGDEVIGWAHTHDVKSHIQQHSKYLPDDNGVIPIYREQLEVVRYFRSNLMTIIPSTPNFYMNFLSWLSWELKLMYGSIDRPDFDMKTNRDCGDAVIKILFGTENGNIELRGFGECVITAFLNVLYKLAEFYKVVAMPSISNLGDCITNFRGGLNARVRESDGVSKGEDEIEPDFDLLADADGMMRFNILSFDAAEYIIKRYSRFGKRNSLIVKHKDIVKPALDCKYKYYCGTIETMEGDVRIYSPSNLSDNSFSDNWSISDF